MGEQKRLGVAWEMGGQERVGDSGQPKPSVHENASKMNFKKTNVVIDPNLDLAHES